jgi:DNA adenine methylase
MPTEPRVHKRPKVSPLRYPGGKIALYPRLRELLRFNGLIGGTYVEPYAGGAGAALGLLLTGQVGRIVINDLDPAIFAFWQAVVSSPAEFAARIRLTAVTVEEWQRQKEIYCRGVNNSLMDYGFATFYLNRTNRSGVLNGGPIGGKSQSGTYKIDARFNKDSLLERVRLIGLYADRIEVRNEDGAAVIEEFASKESTFIYADPPYFEKAGSLYMNSFRYEDHAKLAQCLNRSRRSHWVLTYDDVPEIRRLYSERRSASIPLQYSAHKIVKVQELMVYSDSLAVPINHP